MSVIREDKCEELTKACQEGDVVTVEQLLQTVTAKEINFLASASTSNNSQIKTTSLISAVSGGFEVVVKMLLDVRGINVNLSNSSNTSPLEKAIKLDNVAIVRMLLNRPEIDMKKTRSGDNTMLQVCAELAVAATSEMRSYRNAVFEMILNHEQTDVNWFNRYGDTALSLCCKMGNTMSITSLLEHSKLDLSKTSILDQAYAHTQNDASSKKIQMLVGALKEAMRKVQSDISQINTLMLLLKRGLGTYSVLEWFNFNDFMATNRIFLYKYAIALPLSIEPLWNFHLCRLSTQNATIPESALRIFNIRWPPLVDSIIESFLLPNKRARQSMINVETCFLATINDIDHLLNTQLGEAVLHLDLETVRFLLSVDNLDVNKKSYYSEDVESFVFDGSNGIFTPLTLAIKLCEVRGKKGIVHTEYRGAGSFDPEEFMDLCQIVTLLRDAGGIYDEEEETTEH